MEPSTISDTMTLRILMMGVYWIRQGGKAKWTIRQEQEGVRVGGSQLKKAKTINAANDSVYSEVALAA